MISVAPESAELIVRSGTDEEIRVRLHASDSPALGSSLEKAPSHASVSFQSDREYRFELPGVDPERIRAVYINDLPVGPILMRDQSTVWGRETNGEDIRPFEDCFGWAQLTFILVAEGSEEELSYVSPYIEVQVCEDESETESMRQMVSYVFEHQAELLLEGDLASRIQAGRGKGPMTWLEGKVELARTVADEYTRLYPFFRLGGRFEMHKTADILPFEKLPRVDSHTVQFIATHPEYLHAAPVPTPIAAGGRHYLPEKTLVLHDQPTFDIYENRVVVGFLRLVTHDLVTVCRELAQAASIALPTEARTGYVSVLSGAGSYRMPGNRIASVLAAAEEARDACQHLLVQYENSLDLRPAPLSRMPDRTGIFSRVAEYSAVYELIADWFMRGALTLDTESFFMSLARTPDIYEYYVLAKLVQYMEDTGWVLQSAEPVVSVLPGSGLEAWGKKYRFSKDGLEAGIHFQPVIGPGSETGHGWHEGLYRNNPFTMAAPTFGAANQGRYFRPDFVLSVRSEEKTNYLVVDAKHCRRSTIARREGASLLFRYIASLSVRSSQSRYCGLYVLYGKGSPEDASGSMYELAGGALAPAQQAEWMYLTEKDPPGVQDEKLGRMMSSLLTFN